jgi:hypothetical protein
VNKEVGRDSGNLLRFLVLAISCCMLSVT